MSRGLLLAALVIGAGAALPAAPASAACDGANPCATACDKVAAQYESVIRKFGAPLPGFPLTCPQD